jgi:hypothetical protein
LLQKLLNNLQERTPAPPPAAATAATATEACVYTLVYVLDIDMISKISRQHVVCLQLLSQQTARKSCREMLTQRL